MSCRILYDDDSDEACFYCSTVEIAFGPVFSGTGPRYAAGRNARERAQAFLRWLGQDPRMLDHDELMADYSRWLDQEAAQVIAEAMAQQVKRAEEEYRMDRLYRVDQMDQMA